MLNNMSFKQDVWLAIKKNRLNPPVPIPSQEYGSGYQVVRFYV